MMKGALKKISILSLTGILLLAGCSHREDFAPDEAVKFDRGARVFHAEIPVSEGEGTLSWVEGSAPGVESQFPDRARTRTAIGTGDYIYWHSGDRVSVFEKYDANMEYAFDGPTGARSGDLGMVMDGTISGSGVGIPSNYAVYPHQQSTSVSAEGVISYDFPSRQQYAEGSFGRKAGTMVAMTTGWDDDCFTFHNACGYLVVSLYGDVTIRTITLTGASGERIAGRASITPGIGQAPAIRMEDNATTSITIDCGTSGVALGHDEDSATEFWFAVPPVTFENGFSLRMTSFSGETYTRSTSRTRSIERNVISEIAPFPVPLGSSEVRTGQYLRDMAPPVTVDDDMASSIVSSLLGLNTSSMSFTDQLTVKLAVGVLKKNGDIVINRIVYTTKDPHGNLVEASGIVAYPASKTSYSNITSIQHGTCDIADAPTGQDFPAELMPAFKQGNDVVVLADYLGYGVSRTADLQHPYMHSALTGQTCVDLICAAEEFLTAGAPGMTAAGTDDQAPGITLIGYSQGGAATISTLFELEDRGMGGRVTNVLAGAGPHSMTAFVDKYMSNPDQPFNSSGYLAFLFRGLVYGDCLNVLDSNIFAPEVIANWDYINFDGTQVSSWHSKLGSDVRKIVHPDFFKPASQRNSDVAALMRSIESNSVVNRTPEDPSKVVLYHSETDDIVPYSCSVAARDAWGSQLVVLDTQNNHGQAGLEFYMRYLGLWDILKYFM